MPSLSKEGDRDDEYHDRGSPALAQESGSEVGGFDVCEVGRE